MSLLGTTIGRIRLVDRLGRGGMGEVFVGHDETLDRRVAVKSVPVGHRAGGKLERRFLQEARILSRLDHPNICQIYDFVEGEGRDYLVMELVEGESLKTLTGSLDRKSKLRVAQAVADVLVAAHAEGVVHRDLKPEHVMLTPAGEVKVLDFGIAHSVQVDEDLTQDLTAAAAAAAPHRTRAGSVVGTPRYMSPEQARGEPVTPASDMYTFGLLLQELFTGEKAYEKQPLPDLLTEVGEGRSRPAAGLGRALTDLIERLKSLRPGDRPNAKEAADRLRWIRDTPRRWLRRLAAAAAVLALAAGAAKYTVDLRRERTAAVAARDQAEDLVAFMLEDLSDEMRPVGKLDVLEQVARKALDYYEHTAPGLAGESAYRRGSAYFSVAEVLDAQGDLDAALEAARSAVEVHGRLVASSPERLDWRSALARDHLQLGEVLSQRGETRAAEESLRAGHAIAARLVELDPADAEWRQSLAEALYGLGIFHLFFDGGGDPEKAGAAFAEALAIYRRLAGDDPTDAHFKYRMAVLSGQGLGQVYAEQGRGDESFAAVREAYALYDELTRADPSNSRWQHGFAWENRRLGGHLQSRGRTEEALAHFERAREITERLLSFEPSHVDWQFGLGSDHTTIGYLLEDRGDLEAALASHRRALEVSRRLAATDPDRAEYRRWLAGDHLTVASVLARLGRTDEAEAARQRAVEVLAPDVETVDGVAGETLEVYAVALLHLGRVDAARPVVERLEESGWFEGSAGDELVELCRRHGLRL